MLDGHLMVPVNWPSVGTVHPHCNTFTRKQVTFNFMTALLHVHACRQVLLLLLLLLLLLQFITYNTTLTTDNTVP